MIEKGRHMRPTIPREQRYCPFCSTSIENEIHFLTQCKQYSNRNELFSMVERGAPNFTNLNSHEQFIFLMSQENKPLNFKIISTIHKWFTERLDYEKHKTLQL